MQIMAHQDVVIECELPVSIDQDVLGAGRDANWLKETTQDAVQQQKTDMSKKHQKEDENVAQMKMVVVQKLRHEMQLGWQVWGKPIVSEEVIRSNIAFVAETMHSKLVANGDTPEILI